MPSPAENPELLELRNERDRLLDILHAVAPTRPDTRSLDERMAAVQLELEDVPRRGHADVTTSSGGQYSYDYILEADLMKGIRPLLAKHGIATYYSDRVVSIEAGMARVEITLSLRANGEQIVLTAEGVATDKGDKHVNKAKTNAVRYLLWKTFLQPSDEDPEQSNVDADTAADAERARTIAAGGAQQRTRAGAKTPEQIHSGLIERISKLSVELDEVHGKTPGASLEELQAQLEEKRQGRLAALANDVLVELGKQYAEHVTAERAKFEEATRRGEAADGEAFVVE